MELLLEKREEEKIELLPNLKGITELVYPKTDFREDMYYLPKGEAPIVDEMIRKQRIVQRMQVLNIPAVNTTLLSLIRENTPASIGGGMNPIFL